MYMTECHRTSIICKKKKKNVEKYIENAFNERAFKHFLF